MQTTTIGFPHRTGGLCGDRYCAGSSSHTYDGHMVWKTAEAYARDHHTDGEECPSPNGCDDAGCRKVSLSGGHAREAMTSTDLLIEGGETHHKPGQLLADCSCGGTYTAPAGGNEYATLEAAHVEHVHAAMHHRADGSCVFDVCPLQGTQDTSEVAVAAASLLVHCEEPALKTVPAEPYELPDEVADRDVSHQCGMRHDGEPTHGFVGWVEREHADTYGRDLMDLEWVPFYEAQLPGDTEPTRFCEDCAGWLIGLAPHLLEG